MALSRFNIYQMVWHPGSPYLNAGFGSRTACAEVGFAWKHVCVRKNQAPDVCACRVWCWLFYGPTMSYVGVSQEDDTNLWSIFGMWRYFLLVLIILQIETCCKRNQMPNLRFYRTQPLYIDGSSEHWSVSNNTIPLGPLLRQILLEASL